MLPQWCEVDGCPAAICGSQHVKIIIQDGDEVIVNAEQAARINAGGDTATYRWTLAHLLEVIGEPERTPAKQWTDDEWLRVLHEFAPESNPEIAEQAVARWRKEPG
jgi:hypothetical protein